MGEIIQIVSMQTSQIPIWKAIFSGNNKFPSECGRAVFLVKRKKKIINIKKENILILQN